MSTTSLGDVTLPNSSQFMPRVIRDIVSCCTEEGMIVKGFDRSLDPVRIASYLKPKRVKRAT